ncbi:MAG: UPF0104 family protein [Planctomycetes bacterium]|nr:UPF0104 family protein [Planctomycetota bacterium]
MQTKKLSNYIKRFAKYPILILCIYYLGVNATKISPDQFKPSFIWLVLIFGPLYFLSTFLRAINWQTGLGLLEKVKRKYRDIARIHFKTAIAKYVPSNVMHYAGRHFMGSQIGIDHATILTSNLLDLTLAMLSAGIIVLCALSTNLIEIPQTLQKHYDKYNLPCLAIVCICIMIFFCFIWRKTKSRSQNKNISILPQLLSIVVIYLIFFTASGTVFFLIFVGTGNADPNIKALLYFIAVYVCGWALGFITPGAPGGIGVRESIMVAMLSGTIDPQAALVGALLFRLVTIFGEFLGFIFASTLLKPPSVLEDQC